MMSMEGGTLLRGDPSPLTFYTSVKMVSVYLLQILRTLLLVEGVVSPELVLMPVKEILAGW